jgi:hypothetical protein
VKRVNPEAKAHVRTGVTIGALLSSNDTGSQELTHHDDANHGGPTELWQPRNPVGRPGRRSPAIR